MLKYLNFLNFDGSVSSVKINLLAEFLVVPCRCKQASCSSVRVGRCRMVFLKLWHFITNHANRYERHTTYFSIYVVIT